MGKCFWLTIQIPRLNANYYASNAQTTSTSGQAYLDENSYMPIYLPACTISRLAVRTASTFSGTSSVRLGLYNNGADNIPDTVLIDGGTVSCTASATTYEVTVNQVVTAGWYWTAFRTVTAAANNNYQLNSGSTLAFNQAASSAFTTRIIGITENGASGSFATAVPANFSMKTGAGEVVMMAVRIN